MLLGHFLSYLVFTFAFCHGQNYFFDKIKISQDPTATSVVIDQKPTNKSKDFANSSMRQREELINVENLSANLSKIINVHEMAGEANHVEDKNQTHELNSMENIGGDEELPFSALNSSLGGIFKVKELSNMEKKRLAGILKSMDGKPLPSVDKLQTNNLKNFSNKTGTFSDLNSFLNESNNDDNFETLYPDPDEVLDQLSKELEELIKYHQEPYWEKMKHRIQFPSFYHTHGTISLPYDGIVEPFEAWYAGKYNMSRIDYYYGKLELKIRF